MNIQNYSFTRYYNREALVVENNIVYFGNWNKKATVVLEVEEESEQLKVVREDCRYDFERGYFNTAARVFAN